MEAFNNLTFPLYDLSVHWSSVIPPSRLIPMNAQQKEKRIERRSRYIKFCLGLLANFHDVSPVFFLFQSRGSRASFCLFTPVLNRDSEGPPNTKSVILLGSSCKAQFWSQDFTSLFFFAVDRWFWVAVWLTSWKQYWEACL